MITCANRGSILDATPRRFIPFVLYPHWVMTFIQAFLTFALTVVTIGHGVSHPLVVLVVLGNWFCFTNVLVFVCFAMSSSTGDRFDVVLQSRVKWVVRVLFFCGAGNVPEKKREDEKSVLGLLSNFLEGFDATLSDISACRFLLGRVQRAARNGFEVPKLADLHLDGYPWNEEDQNLLDRSRGGAIPSTNKSFSRELAEDLTYNMAFAFAAYGWLMHVTSGKGSMKGAKKRPTASRKHKWNVQAAEATLSSWPGHDISETVFFSKKNNVGVPVYAIFADVRRKRIVIAIRGTLSLSDAITDVIAIPYELQEADLPPGLEGSGPHYVHDGMWRGSEAILQDLVDRGFLEAMLKGGHATGSTADGFGKGSRGGGSKTSSFDGDSSSSEDDWEDTQKLPDCRGFDILVVGHSLGAGTAQLLCAKMLKRDYPQTFSYAYAEPPVCSEALGRHLAKRNMTVILGDDVVTRLSVRHMEFTRDRMVGLMCHCTLPKWRLIRMGLGGDWSGPVDGMISKTLVSDCAQKVIKDLSGRKASPRFFHGGRVAYIRVLETTRGCCGASVVDSRFGVEMASTDDFGEVIFSRRMVIQHMPDHYRDALLGVMAEWPVDTAEIREEESLLQLAHQTSGLGAPMSTAPTTVGKPQADVPGTVCEESELLKSDRRLLD
eukprot:TRINITY_DN34529_c0_g1_i1.p1 TRINITY_DN34529_c0_g1~~TRINITY_DN34529_c0_g1_i1.p1  ORF type:complete len:759 (-),score=104.20 TRINITY_DN34529_c0_g1_i1:133-2115(-)